MLINLYVRPTLAFAPQAIANTTQERETESTLSR